MARRRRFVTQGAEAQTQGGSGLFGSRKAKEPIPETKTGEPVPTARDHEPVKTETPKANVAPPAPGNMPGPVTVEATKAPPARVDVVAGPLEPNVEVRIESIRRLEEKHALDLAAAVKSAEEKHGREMKQAQDYINGMRGIISGLKRELAERAVNTGKANDERVKGLEARIARLNAKVVRLEYERTKALYTVPVWSSGVPPHESWVQVAVRRQGTDDVITVPGTYNAPNGVWMVPWDGAACGVMTQCPPDWDVLGWRPMERREA